MPEIETINDTYRNDLITVMGDDSAESRQNEQHLEWTFEALLFAFSDGGGCLTEEVIREIIPAETLRLGIDVSWIPYLDEHGNPYPEKVGKRNVHGYAVTEDFYAAFLRLLPVEDYIADSQKPWVHPTPEEIVREVLDERGWNKGQLVEKMQIENGTQYVVRSYVDNGQEKTERVLVIPQDSKERPGLDRILTPPRLNARRNPAQAQHRQTLLRVIRKFSEKYAALEEDQLCWRHS